ncbi:MAG: hypothetical protein M3Q56_01875 [Bacteroidota bacterium]|nr:hypothetical protein [Bacteroidota bacterium]
MSQQIWTFNDQFGIPHSFGIHHGEDSGHLVAYLDDQIIIMDFNIKESKDYHFFINHELLRFKIIKDENAFLYTLDADTESSTPYNDSIKKEEENYKNYMIWGLILFLVFVSILVMFV